VAATFPVSSNDESVDQQIARHYDERPYASESFSYSSPVHIQAAAHLYGVSAPAPQRARVLEVGCAAGGNILPFALAYPDAEVVGVDLSSVQIETGRRAVARSGVKNMTLHAMSLTDIGPEFGKFDYIIAHGLFSWVPPKVRDALMMLCHTNLSDGGVAYISYNTYPGWKAGDILRDAITLHSHGANSEKERVESARAVINLFKDGMASSNRMRGALEGVIASVDRLPDYYLEHEYLESFNSPCYFVEFADLAMRHGLDYVGDAHPSSEIAANFGRNVQLNLSLVAIGQSKLMRQQYLDFLIGQNFRKSLLVKAGTQSSILVQPDAGRGKDLRVAALFKPMDPPTDAPERPGARWMRDTSGHPLCESDTTMLRVIDVLGQVWPRSVSVSELSERIDVSEEDAAHAWRRLIEWGRAFVAMGATPYDIEVTSAPRLIPGIMELLDGDEESQAEQIALSNFWHSTVRWRPNAPQRWVMRHMDGERSEATLSRLLRDAWHSGKVMGPDERSLLGQRNLDMLAQRTVRALREALRDHALCLS